MSIPFGFVLDIDTDAKGNKVGVFRPRSEYDEDGRSRPSRKTGKFNGEAYAQWRRSSTPHPPEEDPEEFDVDADEEAGEEPEEEE